MKMILNLNYNIHLISNICLSYLTLLDVILKKYLEVGKRRWEGYVEGIGIFFFNASQDILLKVDRRKLQ